MPREMVLHNLTHNHSMASAEIVLGSEIIYIPFIISIFGIVGNSMTFLTIIRTEMRKNYANNYILVLLCSDTVLLLNLFLRFWVELDTISFGLCAVMRYIWCTACYVSNLVIVSLTLERFFAIVFPLQHMKNSHLSRWKIILAWLLPTLSLSFNILYALKSTKDDQIAIHFTSSNSEKIKCTFDYEKPFVDLIFHLPRLIFSFILTLIVVTSVNLIIAFKLRARTIFRTAFFKGDSSSKEAQATTIILAVIPLLYVLLNSPFWIRNFLKFFMGNSANYQYINKHYFFTTISYYMFSMNFATNFLVYALISPTFRACFIKLWMGKYDPKEGSSVRYSNATTVMRINSASRKSDSRVVEEAHLPVAAAAGITPTKSD